MDNSKAASQIFDKLADLYESKYMDVSLYSESLNRFCESIPNQSAKILEIGCGPGNITKFLLHQRSDFDIFGIDLAPKMIELAKKNNPTARFEVMDCREINQIQQQFDAVMCGFCLPYLTYEEALELVEAVSQKLSNGGIFYLSTMEDNPSKSGYQKGTSGDEVYMNFYEAGFLTEALEANNFDVIDVQRTITTTNNIKVVDLIIIAQLN